MKRSHLTDILRKWMVPVRRRHSERRSPRRRMRPAISTQALEMRTMLSASAVLVADINPSGSSNAFGLTNVNGTLYFSAFDETTGQELWKSDGTTTVQVADINPSDSSSPKWLTNVNGTLYFSADDGTHGREIWKSDGTTTVQVADVNPTDSTLEIRYLTNVNGTVYFTENDGTTGFELWKTDGTTTVQVADINPTGSSYPRYHTNVNGTLFFSADDGTNGRELWKTDATTTVLVADINPTGASYPLALTNVNGTLFFSANDGTTGRELWKTDGTTTVQVADINPSDSSSPGWLTNVNGTLYFTANDGTNGNELWKTDGTTTVMVADINPSGSSYPRYLTNVNGTLYFNADDGTNGRELWKTDGTTTTLVADINPSGSSDPRNLTNVNGTLYFAADDGTHGIELWKTDGTTTVMVADINPSGASFPEFLTNVNGTLYFSADDGTHGFELFGLNESPTAVDLTNTTTSLPENTDTTTRIKIADISVSDDALGSNTLGLSGADAAFFEIENDVLYLKAETILDYETQNSYAVSVVVYDASLGGAAGSPDASTNFTLSVTPLNDEVPVLSANSLTISEGGTVILSTSDLDATDADLPGDTLTYTVSGISHGQFELVSAPGAPITSFTVDDVVAGNVQFVHDGSELAPAYSVSVSDGVHSTTAAAASITFTNVNDQSPVLSANSLTISEGGTVILSTSDLDATDADLPGDTLTYTVSGISHGQFELVSAPGAPITSFTVDDVVAGNVQFVHDSSELAPAYSVSVSDGVHSTTAAAASITFNNVNDQTPVITINSLTITEGSAVVLTTSNLDATDADLPGDTLTYTVSGITHGQFELVSAPGTAITTFTQANVAAGNVRFVHDGSQQAPGYSVSVSDGVHSTTPGAASITFVSSAPPVISSLGPAVRWVEGRQPVLVAVTSTKVTDSDSPNFDTGVLTVQITANVEASDRLQVRNQGSRAGQIGVAGSNVTFGGVLIGTVSGGDGTTPLAVTLNAAATSAAVTALLKNVTFASVSQNPSTATRTVQVRVTDGDGGSSAPVMKSITIRAVNNRPTLGGFSGSVSYTRGGSPVSIGSGATVTDPDSTNFSGGKLTVQLTTNTQTTDRLTIQNLGTGAGQIGVNGSEITYGDMVIGTFKGGTGRTALVITLNANADASSIAALLQSIQFSTASTSTLTRTLKATLTDGDGGTSDAVTKSITVL